MFELDSNADISSQIDGDRVRIHGGIWRSTDAADPAGWCRLVDVGSADIEPTLVRGFRNAEGTSAMYEVAIDQRWSEDNRISGRGVRAGGNWMTNTPLYATNGFRQPVEDLRARSETVPETVVMHDGSGSYPKDLYWWDDGAGEWVRVGDGGTRITPS